jgi:AAA domain
LSVGRQTVLPPTIHPGTGLPYFWSTMRTLLDTNIEALPELPADYISRVEGAIKAAGLVVDIEEEPKPKPAANGHDEDNPYAELNNLAIRNLEKWVPDLGLYKCRRKVGRYASYEAVATWRESSTGRPKEDRKLNLQISGHRGIKDFGTGKGYSPIDLVMAARGCERADAIEFLLERLKGGPNVDWDKLIAGTMESSSAEPECDAPETDTEETEAKGTTLPPLTIGQWRSRDDVEDPDFLMGEMLSTTSRMLLVAATGLGKTQLATALAIHIAAGKDFLHWKASRSAKVLYIDGEMSKRQLRKRILDLARRFTGPEPETLYFLSHEDVPNFAPLNTKAGQKWLDGFIERLGGVDLIIFDSIMCLTLGEQKDPDVWRAVIPWARDLTTRGIGQVWVHHTGHDETRSYGDKSREWQLDVVAILTKEDDGKFVSFKMEFKKARERHSDNYQDFAPRHVSLADDEWVSEAAEPSKPKKAGKAKTASDHCLGILAELMRTKAMDFPQALGRNAVLRHDWQEAAVSAGVCGNNTFRNLKAKLKLEGKIAELADFVWIAAPQADSNEEA